MRECKCQSLFLNKIAGTAAEDNRNNGIEKQANKIEQNLKNTSTE